MFDDPQMGMNQKVLRIMWIRLPTPFILAPSPPPTPTQDQGGHRDQEVTPPGQLSAHPITLITAKL